MLYHDSKLLLSLLSGFWRLGAPTGGALLGLEPDVACFGKLLTGGTAPISMTLASEDVFNSFLGASKVGGGGMAVEEGRQDHGARSLSWWLHILEASLIVLNRCLQTLSTIRLVAALITCSFACLLACLLVELSGWVGGWLFRCFG